MNYLRNSFSLTARACSWRCLIAQRFFRSRRCTSVWYLTFISFSILPLDRLLGQRTGWRQLGCSFFISATVGRSQNIDPFINRFGTRPKPLPYTRVRSASLLYWQCYSLSLNQSVYRSVRKLIASKRILTGSLIPSSSFFRINWWCAKITTFHYSFPKSIKEIAFHETWAPVRYYSNSRFDLWHINLVFLH